MKPGKTWLQAAMRAHQARTLDQQYHAREAWNALLAAAEQQRQAAGRLGELSAGWSRQRAAGLWDPALEALYQHFHGHLHDQADLAALQHSGCQQRWESTKAELQRTHATQRLLEATAQRAAAATRRELSAREVLLAAEAWLLGRLACGSDSHGDRPEADAATTHPSGGANDPGAR